MEIRCPECEGAGTFDNEELDCEECEGYGTIVVKNGKEAEEYLENYYKGEQNV